MSKRWQSRLTNTVALYFELLFSNTIKRNLLQALPLWTASILVGLVAVGYTKLFGLMEDLLRQITAWQPWTIFIMAPLCFLLAWMTVQRFAANARGSGIPQVMASLELTTPKHEKSVSRLLGLRIAATKIVSSLLMLLGGGAIGREGPTIQIAGSLFYVIHRWVPKSWPKLSNQSFILTGAAGGLAAAFNTPLGGIVFAIEELAKIHIRYFRTALFSAVIIAGLTAQAFLGPYLYLGYADVRGLNFSIFLGVFCTAIIAAILGSLMCKAIIRVMQWKARFSKLKVVAFIIVAGLSVATLSYFSNSHILGSGKDLMNDLLFTQNKATTWDTVLMRMAGPVIAFNTGAAGGVFAPSLAAGASVGGFISGLFAVSGAQANILILCGMVGFLTGVTRTPFTSAILVLEMTDRHSVIFHLMLAAMVANVAALAIEKHSFYELLKKGYVEDVISK